MATGFSIEALDTLFAGVVSRPAQIRSVRA